MNESSSNSMNATDIGFGCLVGISLPAILLGRSVTGVILILALLLYPLVTERSRAFGRFRGVLTTPLALLVLLVFCSWLPQLFSTVDLWVSSTTVLRSGLMVLAAAVLWSVLVSDEDVLQCSLKSFLIASLVLATLANVALFLFPSLYSLMRGTFDPTLSPVIGLKSEAVIGLKSEAASVALMIPLSLWAGWILSGRWRVIGFVVVVEFLAIVFVTENRASVAGLMGALVVVVLVYGYRFKGRRWFAVSFLATLVFVSAAFEWVLSTRQGRAIPSAVETFVSPSIVDWHRQIIWQATLEQSSDNRWAGVGVNAINFLPVGDEVVEGTGAKYLPNHPHNWFFEVLAETGVIGIVSLLVTILYSFLFFARKFVHQGNPCLLAVIGVWVIYWASGLFNFSYWSAWWQASFYVLTAICLAGVAGKEPEETSRTI